MPAEKKIKLQMELGMIDRLLAVCGAGSELAVKGFSDGGDGGGLGLEDGSLGANQVVAQSQGFGG